jgi:hypothetical protein
MTQGSNGISRTDPEVLGAFSSPESRLRDIDTIRRLQIEVAPSKRCRFATAHTGPEQIEEPRMPPRIVLCELRQDRFGFVRVKWVLGPMRTRSIKTRKRPGVSLAFRIAT